jgi:hypothetical protein
MSCQKIKLKHQLKEIWTDRIVAWKASDKSGLSWCREHDLSYRQFIYWKNRLEKPPTPLLGQTDFVELPQLAPTGIEIEFNGIHIHLTSTFDTATLERLISVLRRLSCSH